MMSRKSGFPAGISRAAFPLWAALLLALAAGCDSAPGLGDLDQRPPTLSNLAYSPRTVLLDQLPVVSDGVVRATLEITAQGSDADSDLAQVGYLIQSVTGGVDPIAAGDLANLGAGQYGATIEVDIDTGLTGAYTLLVYAFDAQGNLANELRGRIDMVATGAPPVLLEITMPETVQRPADGEPPVIVPIIARVSDPDGLSNVDRVDALVNGAVTLRLCDDGGVGACNSGFSEGSGDAVAGDGAFTLTLIVESTNSAGANTFLFEAVDRDGLRSEAITRTIVLE